ncbi:MAG: type IV toxin-antitoxin system AbiEi family antitoxin domain-containing protein [Verrucomicrobia bacterium]|nr:type IV toxin-antitoxin system AbiEi family antitoxin domain-containing protein [Verrucomicrobiota bacterium]MBU4429443.1 type IV toxin-antitoxin system AbiEi family antitoxin domain-containing protein [Verrucomicrobiota bacterium]MCG2679946.1 type IV toxin-antitoxin system AbiEi family antitoxin domain-containing protein [Kiritimatiellia bacterium]
MQKANTSECARARAIRLMRASGGMVRSSEALRVGIHSRTLCQLREEGILEQVSRGIYHLANQATISNPDLVTVAMRIPKAVVCLISALAFHELTTQIPHAVYIALKKGAEPPRLEYPPISVHRFSAVSLNAGIEQHLLDGVKVRIYSPEKTLADVFKFRNKIGMDVVIEALNLYKTRKAFNLGELLKYAGICRIEKVMRPYLEAMI